MEKYLDHMTTERKNTILTFGLYVLAVLAVTFINLSGQFKSGPCTPNLDLLSFFLLGPLSFIGSLITAFETFFKKKPYRGAFFVNLLALGAWWVFLNVN